MLEAREMGSFSNISSMCRTCLLVQEDLKPLFESQSADMLNECQFIQVSENDELPRYICSKCYDLLLQSCNFRKQCRDSEVALKRLISEGLHFTKRGKPPDDAISDDSNDQYEASDPKYIPRNVCVHSHKSFSTSQGIKKHLEVHEKKRLRRCNECNERFKNTLDVESHFCVKKIENDKRELKRGIPDDFTAFLDDAPPPPLPFPCAHCTQSFNVQCDLDLHLSTHTRTSEFLCTRCNKQFATRQILKRHIKTHLLHKPHVCRECGKGFAESHALTKHMRKHSGLPREKKHLCTVCGQGFSEPFYLNVHMRKHTGERPLMCSACGKAFADPRSLKAHNMTHTGERPYKCDVCGKAFSQSVNLRKHIRVHTGEKPYICSECGKCFTQSSSLDKHMRTHTGERPYACEYCPKRFAEKGTLIHHTRTHTGEKPYICDQCGRGFASSSELKLHDRKHSGIKKNVCNVCGKDFATPSNLLVHSRTHSGEKPFVCEDCGRAFADKGSLKKHLKIHNAFTGEEKCSELIKHQNTYVEGEAIKSSEEQAVTCLQSLNTNIDSFQLLMNTL